MIFMGCAPCRRPAPQHDVMVFASRQVFDFSALPRSKGAMRGLQDAVIASSGAGVGARPRKRRPLEGISRAALHKCGRSAARPRPF